MNSSLPTSQTDSVNSSGKRLPDILCTRNLRSEVTKTVFILLFLDVTKFVLFNSGTILTRNSSRHPLEMDFGKRWLRQSNNPRIAYAVSVRTLELPYHGRLHIRAYDSHRHFTSSSVASESVC